MVLQSKYFFYIRKSIYWQLCSENNFTKMCTRVRSQQRIRSGQFIVTFLHFQAGISWITYRSYFALWSCEFPARPCDLTTCNFFLWAYVKSNVYANNPTTIEELKINTRNFIHEITAEMCENAIINWTDRMRYLRMKSWYTLFSKHNCH